MTSERRPYLRAGYCPIPSLLTPLTFRGDHVGAPIHDLRFTIHQFFLATTTTTSCSVRRRTEALKRAGAWASPTLTVRLQMERGSSVAAALLFLRSRK